MSLTLGQLQQIDEAKEVGKKVVLVTGVFDILHQEHRLFLQKARQAGDFLIIGIESDVRVTALKGPTRPINSETARLTALEKLGLAQVCFILPETFNDPLVREQLIARVRPRFLAVSSHTDHLDKKQALLSKYGGEVVIVHRHNPAVSTTLLVESADMDLSQNN